MNGFTDYICCNLNRMYGSMEKTLRSMNWTARISSVVLYIACCAAIAEGCYLLKENAEIRRLKKTLREINEEWQDRIRESGKDAMGK